MTTAASMTLGEPVLRWSARAHSIAEIETELARIWSGQDLTATIDGETVRHVPARTSVMNLVVVARRPEIAERCAATMQELTGRHPSRTIVISAVDPDGPSWLDARVEAHCIVPREDAPETCAETIHLTCGGEAGLHLSAIATPLIVHDLPVTVWWPGEPPLKSRSARDLLAEADRLIVDGSSWSGDGLARLREMAELVDTTDLAVSDFALVRQSRWREAIASIFDDPDFLPYLRSLRRIAVTYSTHDEAGAPGSTNLVKPVYHVGWLASRLATHGPQAAGRRRDAPAGPRPRDGEAGDGPGHGRDPVRRPRRGRRRGAPGPVDDPVRHDAAGRAPRRAARIGAARRCHRGGGDRPRPRLAGWRGSHGTALPGTAQDRDGAARRSDRDGPPGPRRGRRPAIGRRDRRSGGSGS